MYSRFPIRNSVPILGKCALCLSSISFISQPPEPVFDNALKIYAGHTSAFLPSKPKAELRPENAETTVLSLGYFGDFLW
jgi:hypothetical protein